MKKTLTLVVLCLLSSTISRAARTAMSGGLTLIEPSGARVSALGTAVSAVRNDIGAFQYNPASLQSLERVHASFMYQKGVFDDAYSHFAVGSPGQRTGVGLSVGHYNSGTMKLIDENGERTVTAQSDLLISVGASRPWKNGAWGITAKYLSSELAETASAQALAADLGVQLSTSRLNFGLAMQNFGTKLAYQQSGDPLPRIARAGMSMTVFKSLHPTTLLLEMPYYLNEAEVRPAVGVEVLAGAMALRGGYQSRNGRQRLSVGTGIALGAASLDYAFGFAKQIQAEHRISISSRFGSLRREIALKDSQRPVFSLAMPD